jgi:two-component system, chemotaxis family, chemotaxis protein CheY
MATPVFGMKQMKILIVDDNQQVRNLLRDYLPTSFDEIYECSDGDDALLSFRKHQPDWVLMDWEMPKMNGIKAIRQIIGEFPEANICMVTAFNDEEIRKEAFAAGASGFVLKDNLFELEDIFAGGFEH